MKHVLGVVRQTSATRLVSQPVLRRPLRNKHQNIIGFMQRLLA